uniref:Uncharacterized protein n=1 Tax=Ditylenchus dipsaci TaxID=166011 RepID=A0A915CWV2_9BILA
MAVKNRRLSYFLNQNFGYAPYRVFRSLQIRINLCGIQLICCKYLTEMGIIVSYEWLSTYQSIWFEFVNIELAPKFSGHQANILTQICSLNKYWKNEDLTVSLLPYKGLDNVSSVEQERYEDLLDKILRSSNIMTCRYLSVRVKYGKVGSPLHSYPLLHRRQQLILTQMDWNIVLEQVVDYLHINEIFDSKVIIVLDFDNQKTANLLLKSVKKRFSEATVPCPLTFSA